MANPGIRVGIGSAVGNGTGGSNRGFAGMDHDKQRAIASKGGSASGGNFANNPERARAAGRKGGEVSGGNFASGTRSVLRKQAARAVRHRGVAAIGPRAVTATPLESARA